MTTKAGGSGPSIRYRPIYGGIFGRSGEYTMGTMACVERGLHSVRYMVLNPRSGGVLSVASDKTEALAQARRVLRAAATLTSANDANFVQGSLWNEHELPKPVPGVPIKPKAVPRRRREVFERTGGLCFYCSAPLDIQNFEIEHQFPKALGGDDLPLNTVPSCRRCNRSKGTLTALQFIAQSAERSDVA